MPIQLDLPPTVFAVVSLPTDCFGDVLTAIHSISDFVSVTRDRDEITLIVAEDWWHERASEFPGAQVQWRRRLIRFDTVLDFSVVGFIAEISRALAEADISILSLSTYRTDAILVHEANYHRALAAVQQALVTLHHTLLTQM